MTTSRAGRMHLGDYSQNLQKKALLKEEQPAAVGAELLLGP